MHSSSANKPVSAVEELRLAASKTLQKLSEAPIHDEHLIYWLGGGSRLVENDAYDTCRFFQAFGFLHVPSFAAGSECVNMKEEMTKLVEEHWKPERDLEEFSTDARQNTARTDYFLESANNIHYFAEPLALEKDAVTSRQRLRPEYEENKVAALNKAGHALHMQPGVFRDYCLSTKVRKLVQDLGWKDPVVPQSMYIFKQAGTGGVVNSHQDSTFLFTEPYQSCLGLWLALDDATLDNGCLWVRPGSHREAVRRQYRRNPAHFGDEAIESCSNVPLGDVEAPKFILDDLYKHDMPWDGSLPEGGIEGLLAAGFVPVECKAGDLLAFCGELDHLSLENNSINARHTFQLHLIEGPTESVVWSKSNWLQYTDGELFQSLLSSH